MILKKVRGNIFLAPQKHVVFAVNTQGYNDSGFAGQVSSRVWPELANTGGNTLGEVLIYFKDFKRYYALVCHSLDTNGWVEAPKIIEKCLNELPTPDNEEIAVVSIGSGPIGIKQGADAKAILSAMEKSKKKLVLYTQ